MEEGFLREKKPIVAGGRGSTEGKGGRKGSSASSRFVVPFHFVALFSSSSAPFLTQSLYERVATNSPFPTTRIELGPSHYKKESRLCFQVLPFLSSTDALPLLLRLTPPLGEIVVRKPSSSSIRKRVCRKTHQRTTSLLTHVFKTTSLSLSRCPLPLLLLR